LMVAIIGGETHRFRPLIDLYRQAGMQAGYSPDQLKVGVHSLGYVAESTQEAVDDFFPGYARTMSEIGKERGWPKMTRASFDAQRGPQGALLVGDPDEVAEKIVRHNKALGGISRITFMMNPASLSHEKLIRATKLIGTRITPILHEVVENEVKLL
jgi:alkanesulfonate monooxygenase SsuD/methylene tetrahydromethanopterin reductase-like flavin-dependent oxidoreductase (luciferase family)